MIHDSVDEGLQLQTRVRSDGGGGGGGSDPQGPPPGSATGGGKYLMYDHVQESPC